MKKTDTQIQIPTKQRKIIPRNPMKEHAERRNPTSNQCEFHRDDTGYGHPIKKFQNNQNKEYEKTQEQIKETTEALNKHQSETKNTINREINELREKIDNIKEVTHDMENLKKKKKATEIQNKMEGQSSTLEQAEERISELKDEMVIKRKTEELLVRQPKTC
jgi:paraquat-inducible protein B